MRILWCAHSLVGFKIETGGYNGCGWITSLLGEFVERTEVEIGIAFYYNQKSEPIKRGNVTFYPIKKGHIGVCDKIRSFWGNTDGWHKEEKRHSLCLEAIIEDFHPDVIHVWGTETDMGLIANKTSIPVVVHLQGLLHPYNNSLCPPGLSKWDYIRKGGFSPIKLLANLNGLQYWRYKAEREIRIFASCNNFFGRTHWDKAVSKLFAPNSNYYYCSEMLREEFYSDNIWNKPADTPFHIISTISEPLYKGMDMVLKTAKLLKDHGRINFVWNIIGVKQATFIEKKIGIKASDVNISLLGVKTASEIKELELSSNLYFHPSYIDNSPNSICEAQILGMPVMAVNVGGVATLVEHTKTGWLVPSNEPHVAAQTIIELLQNKEKLSVTGMVARKEAKIRHDKRTIVADLLNGYSLLMKS